MAIDGSTTKAPMMLTDTKVAAFKPTSNGVEYRDLGVTGLRVRVGSSGKKTWLVRARAGDKIVNRKLGAYPGMTLASARVAAQQLMETLTRDGSTETLDRTFREAAEQWVDRVAKPKNSSWRLQQRRLEMHVLPKWGHRKIADLRRRDVRELLDGVEGDVLPNRVLAIVKTVFRFALSRDWIDTSPAEGVEKPKTDGARDHVLTMDDIARVWRATDLLGFPFGQYVKVLMLTGQRRTEVASMRWDAVDLDAGTWAMQSSETKNGRGHLVPLSPAVVAILGALPRFGQFVFTTDGETHISGYAKLKTKLDTFLEVDASDVIAQWRFHDLRRSAATHLVRLGVLEEVVGKVLNHAPKGVTAKVYALHRYEPEKRNALDRWAAEVDRAVNGTDANQIIELRPTR